MGFCATLKVSHTCTKLSQQLTPQQAQASLGMHYVLAALGQASRQAGAPIVGGCPFLSLVFRVAAPGTASRQPAQQALVAGAQDLSGAFTGALHSCKLGACAGSCLSSCSSQCLWEGPPQRHQPGAHCSPSALLVRAIAAALQLATGWRMRTAALSVSLCCMKPGAQPLHCLVQMDRCCPRCGCHLKWSPTRAACPPLGRTVCQTWACLG